MNETILITCTVINVAVIAAIGILIYLHPSHNKSSILAEKQGRCLEGKVYSKFRGKLLERI